jgi:hypothetical protein
MDKPADSIVEAVAPSRDIDGMTISDGTSVRNTAHAEIRDSLRIPRGGHYASSLVAVRRYYDGSGGGEAGDYLMLWIEFRSGSRWRTAGVKVRAVEAARLARDMMANKGSKPGRSEPRRVGGKTLPTDDSELRGVPVDGGGFLVFVRHKSRTGAYARTRGVEVLDGERAVVAGLLKMLITERP